MKKSICFGLITFLFGILFASAEKSNIPANLTATDAINYINGKIKGTAQIKDNRGLMCVDFFDKGKVIRTDMVSFSDLDADQVSYLNDEKAIVVKCEAKECIDRKILVPKSRGRFSRISIQGDFDEKTQQGLVHAFQHLILLFRDPKYKSSQPFER